jgi:hypothetical protein
VSATPGTAAQTEVRVRRARRGNTRTLRGALCARAVRHRHILPRRARRSRAVSATLGTAAWMEASAWRALRGRTARRTVRAGAAGARRRRGSARLGAR